MVSDKEFLAKAKTLVSRFERVRAGDPIPPDLASDLERLKRTKLAMIDAQMGELDFAIGTLDSELNAGRLSKDKHRRLYSDFAAQKADLESDRNMLALGDGGDFVQLLGREQDERKYGSYDNRPKIDPRKVKEHLGLKKAADDGMLMWAWAFTILALGSAVMIGILSGRWMWAALLLAGVFVFVAVTSAIIYAAARVSQVEEATAEKAVVFTMSSVLLSALICCALYALLLFWLYQSGSDSYRWISDLDTLERTVSSEKVIVHSLWVVGNFAVSLVCARRVFSTSLEKAAETVILGYVFGLIAWIVIAVVFAQRIIF